MKLSATYQGLFEAYQRRGQAASGDPYEGHAVFLMHAGYLGILQPDLLYQLWFNFRLFPQKNQSLVTVEIPAIVVSDLLLSGLCKEIGPETFLIEADLRQQLQLHLRQDPRFGLHRQRQLASFLTQYGQRTYQQAGQERLKELHEQLSTATLNPRLAATRLAKRLREAIEQGDQREQARLAMITDWFDGEDEAFDQLLRFTRHIKNTLRGDQQTDLVLPGLQVAQEGEEGPVIRMPVPAHLAGRVQQSPDESTFLPPNLQAEIEAVREGKQHHLDLSNLRLPFLPPTLGRLPQLRRLSLANNALTALHGLERLSQLERLDISGNELTLLQGVEALPKLRALFAGENPLKDIEALRGLSGLQGLNLQGGTLSDLTPLETLSSLRSLNLSHHEIRDLSPLSQLQQLQHLHLTNNQISDIRPLLPLEQLLYLDLTENLLPLPSPIPSNPQRLLELLQAPPIQQASNFQPPTNQSFVVEEEPKPDRLPKLRRLAGEKGRLFALVIGIDQYPEPIAPLRGAVNDAKAIEALLYRKAKAQNWALWMLTLLDEQASREQVIAGFRNHLTEAEEGDEVLIYFAGRGSQEICPRELQHLEPDGRNETFVLWDSREEGNKDLADKEFATVLSAIRRNGPNITVWLDCSTQTDSPQAINGPSIRSWQMDERVHPLSAYLLPSIISKSGRINLPQTPHLTFQAGRQTDPVQEMQIGQRVRGLFTYAIEEVVHQQVADQSNAEFAASLDNRVRLRSQLQRPWLLAYPAEKQTEVLLGGLTHFSSFFYRMEFDHKADSWRVDGGTMGGLVPRNPATGEVSLLQVFPEGLSEEDWQNPALSLGLFEVENLGEQQAWGTLRAGTFLDPSSRYIARVLSLPIPLIGIALAESSATWEDDFLRELPQHQEAETYLQWTRSDNAQWLIEAAGNSWKVFRKAEFRGQVLFELFGNRDLSYGLDKLVENLVHLAKFQAVLQLRNPNTTILPSQIGLQIDYEQEFSDMISREASGYLLRFQEPSEPVKFHTSLTNFADLPLYFSLLYADKGFQIRSFLKKGSRLIQPGETFDLFDGRAITARFSTQGEEINPSEYQESFLLIVSHQPIDPTVLELSGFNQTMVPTRSITEYKNSTELLFDTANPFDHQQDWTVKRVNVTYRLDR